MAWTSLCETAELEENKGHYVEIDGYKLAVFFSNNSYYVIDNYCPHAGGSLSGGFVEDGCAVCPWHYWAFRLENGELKTHPGVKVSTYNIRLLEREGKPTLLQADLPMP